MNKFPIDVIRVEIRAVEPNDRLLALVFKPTPLTIQEQAELDEYERLAEEGVKTC